MSVRRTPRKNQTGSSNATNDGISEKSLNSKTFRCIMQRIVERDPPDEKAPEVYVNPKARSVQKMAVWTANKDTTHDSFSTTSKSEYNAEDLIARRASRLSLQPELIKVEQDPERLALIRQSFEEFRKMSKREYGHAAKLFKAGRKSKQDSVTADEFSYLIKRLKLEKQFSKENQELMFESLPRAYANTDSVKVVDIIGRMDELDMKDASIMASKKEMLEIKNFFSQKLEEKRAKGLIDDDLVNEITSSEDVGHSYARENALRRRSALMRKSKTFNSEVEIIEMDEVRDDHVI